MTGAIESNVTTTPAGREGGGSHARPLIVIVVAAAICTAIWMRFPWLNGPWYWTWSWNRQGAWPFVPCMAAAAVPLLAGVVTYHRTRRRDWGLFLVMLGGAALTLTTSVLQPQPSGFERTIRVVRSPNATSYYTAAWQYLGPDGPMSVKEFLAQYPEMTGKFYLHAQTKPPGPILYHAAVIKLLGRGYGGALAAGMGLLVLAMAGSVLGTSRMVSSVMRDQDAGFYAAACMALCPGFVVFYPGFDMVWPAVACAMVGTWVAAVRTGEARWAIAYGLALALALFCTYVLLLLGAFLAAYAAASIWLVSGVTVRRLLRQAAIAFAVVAAVYVLLWILTGYSAIAAYQASTHHLTMALKWVKRPYPVTIPWDLYDFALGAGWLVWGMGIFFVSRGRREITGEERAIAWFAMGMPILVAVTGLVQGETSRCWQLLLPLLLISAGAELRRWDRGGRLAFYICMLAVLIVIAGRMVFIGTEPIWKLEELGLL